MTERASIEKQVCLKAAVELVSRTLEADKALPGGGKDSALAAVRVAEEFWKWISAARDREEVHVADRPEGGDVGTSPPSGHTHSWVKKNETWDYCTCGKARRREAARDDSAEDGNRGQA